MKIYITIDGGTTNTRISLVKDGNLEKAVKIPVGAKKSIGGNEELKSALADGIKTILSEKGLSEGDVTAVIASGMITSEFGLVNLPHITAPAGLAEIKDGISTVTVPEVTSLPITFIRGVKTEGSLEATDMMRGEETELMGIASPDYGECVYVLPGSHSKIIYTDAQGRITRFSTTLTGEMIAALSEGTILKDAVSLSCEKLDTSHLEHGFSYAKAHGINEALFKTRILKNLFGKNESECYSFFLGAVLLDEIRTIIGSSAETVVIGGKRQIKEAIAYLVGKYLDKRTVVLTDAEVDRSTTLGMIKIFEAKNGHG